MLKYVLIGAGFCSLGLGIAGIFLPVLPTTPFMLLAASCFFKSSDRLYDWIRSHPAFGAYIDNYLTHRAISRRNKTVSVSVLWLTLGLSAAFATDSGLIRIILLLVGAGVTVHLLLIKTLPEDSCAENADDEPGQ